MSATFDSHLTLHYRISLADEGVEVFSTFGAKPATIQLGYGHMAEPLERCLMGINEGDSKSFTLAATDAFGDRNPELIQTLSRATFDANSTEKDYELGDLVEFPTPDGGRYAGVLKQLNDQNAVFDFNHPLAGKRIQFDVQIIGVL